MKPSFFSARFFLMVVLLISLLLRWALVMQGGQLFNPDEYRYLTSRVIARELQKGNVQAAVTEATSKADHLGFKIIGILPALAEVKHDRDINSKTAFLPGVFFSLFSWLNILIVWRLALKLGADEREALWAAVLMATSSALFYYASHLFPYDFAMAFGLLALYVGISAKGNFWVSIATGLLGFLCFFSYNGYWSLTALAFVIHIFNPIELNYRLILKSIWVGLGFFIPFVLILWISTLYGNNLWKDYVAFSNTIINGAFSEGAILPFKYFWASEHLTLILWLVLFSFAVITAFKTQPKRLLVGLIGITFVYLCLAVSSVILQKFVVYGRLARQLVPFLALTGAYSLRIIEMDRRLGKVSLALVLCTLVIQAGVNFWKPLHFVYPEEFIEQAQERYPDFRPPRNMTYFYSPNVTDVGPYKAYFIQFVYPLPKEEIPIEGKVLMSAENPLSDFPPFWYDEGYSPEERSAFPSLMMRITIVE